MNPCRATDDGETGMGAAASLASGVHWLIDFFGVDAARLGDVAALETLLVDAACAAGAQIVFLHFHRFVNHNDVDGAGVTGVVLLAESHITIHTWPERGYAALDLFLCGATRPQAALTALERALLPTRCEVQQCARGEPWIARSTLRTDNSTPLS